MPCRTERQQTANALQRAFLVNLMAEHEEDLLDFDSDSFSSDDDDPQPTVSEMLLETLGDLYSQRYLKEHAEITKAVKI